MLIFWRLTFPLRVQMLLSFVSVHHWLRVCCTKAIQLSPNVFVIKHYWLPQSITLATVVPLSNTLHWSGGGCSRGRHGHVGITVRPFRNEEVLYCVLKWSLSIHFHHKSTNSVFLSPLSIGHTSVIYLTPLCSTLFHHFLFAPSFAFPVHVHMWPDFIIS